MNTTQISKVLTKHVEYFQGVYPIDLLPSTHIKPSIIVINLDKIISPVPIGYLFASLTLVMPNILIHMVCRHTNSKSCQTCKATQFLGHSTATDYKV